MTRRRIGLVLLTLGALGAGLCWFDRGPRPGNTVGTRTDTRDAAPAPQAAPSPVAPAPRQAGHADPARSPTLRPAHMPPPSADVAQIEHIRYWREQADSGDPYAQCRYAREAQHCAALIMNTADWMRERFVAEMVRSGDFGEIPDCRGVNLQDILPQFDRLLQAAAAGHTPSQVLFAAGGGFALAEGVRFPDRLHRFRDHAATLAWRAFDAGDPDAVVLLWRAYHGVDRDGLFLAGAIEPNPVTARALDLLMHELNAEHVIADRSEHGLSQRELDQAQAMLRDWRAHAFAHPRPPRHGLRIETMFDWEKRAVDLCADAESP